MNKVRKCTAFQQVNNVLNSQNRLLTAVVHSLPINSPILVYRKINIS